MALDAVTLDLSCPDWWDRLQRGEVPIPDVALNARLADRATRAFDQLRLPDVIGQPMLGTVGVDWFRQIVGTLFGAVDDRGERAIRELFLLVPKKQGKTTNAAALGLVWLLLNDIPNATGLIVAATQKIAETGFGQAQGMIAADPDLAQLLHVQEHRKRIVNLQSGAVLEIKTFDMKVLTGDIPVFCLVDELHLLGTVSYAKKVIGQIRGGLIKAGSLLVSITTQSTEEPAGVFRQELFHARNVRDGLVPSDGVLAVLYEFPEEVQRDKTEPYLDPALWRCVLPSLGKSTTVEFLQRNLRQEMAKGKDGVRLWLSQHLNIQIGLGLHSDRWVGADHWEACGNEALTLDALLERSEVVVAGIDGGGLDDLLGLAVLGRCAETRRWLHWGHAWAMSDIQELRQDIAPRLQDFVELGQLTLCDMPGEDVADLAEIVGRIVDAGLLAEAYAIGLDPHGVADVVDALLAIEGVTEDQITAVGQGYRLNAAIGGLPRTLKRGGFEHGAQDLMSWAVGNAKTELAGSARVVTKRQSGTAKIDPLMALFNAVMLMNRNPEPAQGDLTAFLDNPVMLI